MRFGKGEVHDFGRPTDRRGFVQDEGTKRDGDRGSRQRVHFTPTASLSAVVIASEDGTPPL